MYQKEFRSIDPYWYIYHRFYTNLKFLQKMWYLYPSSGCNNFSSLYPYWDTIFVGVNEISSLLMNYEPFKQPAKNWTRKIATFRCFKIQCDNRSISNGRLIFVSYYFTNSVWNCLWYSLSSKKQKREVKGIQ